MNKKLKIGDLVSIKDNTHWDGSSITRSGIITGPGAYYNSYMVLFVSDGSERQFHSSFITLISQSSGEQICFKPIEFNKII